MASSLSLICIFVVAAYMLPEASSYAFKPKRETPQSEISSAAVSSAASASNEKDLVTNPSNDTPLTSDDPVPFTPPDIATLETSGTDVTGLETPVPDVTASNVTAPETVANSKTAEGLIDEPINPIKQTPGVPLKNDPLVTTTRVADTAKISEVVVTTNSTANLVGLPNTSYKTAV